MKIFLALICGFGFGMVCYKIISNTCTFEQVVYRDFAPGVTILPFGGPISADPIFIKSLNDLPLGVKSFKLLEPDSDSL